jgi:hypothetical protein
MCTPQIGNACALTVTAEASDPDGDPLTYLWSGCASGTAPRATCIVDRPGPVLASVVVGDNHGHMIQATGSGVGGGENRSPGVQIGYITVFPSGTIELLGNVLDPDEGLRCGSQYCVSVSASGACGAPVGLRCTCLAGLEADVTRTAAAGMCSVTFSVKDSWGEIGNPVFTFDVSKPTADTAK